MLTRSRIYLTFFSLIRNVGLNFFRYLRSLGIDSGSELVVLSPGNDYFFGADDLRKTKVLVNLQKLNLIKHLDLFLKSLVMILPPGTSFVGCFSDRNVFYHDLMSIFRKRHRILDRHEVADLLEQNGFHTIDMREMNGVVYFVSKNS